MKMAGCSSLCRILNFKSKKSEVDEAWRSVHRGDSDNVPAACRPIAWPLAAFTPGRMAIDREIGSGPCTSEGNIPYVSPFAGERNSAHASSSLRYVQVSRRAAVGAGRHGGVYRLVVELCSE